MTFASIIVPAYNVASTIEETLASLLAQTHPEYEIIVVDDGSRDDTPEIATRFARNPKVRVIHQPNRGLAGARNTGIAAARGEIIGFCDADDHWLPEKLARHVAHFERAPEVGVSYSGSALMDDAGRLTGMAQTPRLTGIDPSLIFKRNPIGNGSAVMLRRAVLDEIAFRPASEPARTCWFDESFRQSEDIECWLRIALSTEWRFEGIAGALTRYRINSGGLSAATDRQLAAWERMVEKLEPLNPSFFEVNTPAARAYQLRYLARRAVSDMDGARALRLCRASLASSALPLLEDTGKTLVTLAAAGVLRLIGAGSMRAALSLAGAR
ncbi:glycosyltransferase family 2 protein [Pelagovum pacificum]|uniref:Glycosyltransferase family 2 protein n=1 Tax=Pelagovum pacificum TaxID=2588711 RepID=A0A5C5GBY8_9RHOB|nr:glycosyltransferase family 2 protein [Pelagovum pacificum]QQA44724.1 glycosyltransferase family 2 protein [Pelagovum pacificum]TNY32168.1 glycosyltransferase family 2 protein [Pelagovum pacificum]